VSRKTSFDTNRRSFLAVSAGVAALSGADAESAPFEDPMVPGTSVKNYGAKGDGVTDDTNAIQAALDRHIAIWIPPGVYRTTRMLKVKGHQVVRGAGSQVSVIKNNSTDCFGKDDIAMAEGNYFQISGIGCVRDFDPRSRAKAFNLSNASFVKCDDIAATNFHTALYLARDNRYFDGGENCWYNAVHRLTVTECHTGVHIDDGKSNQSVNGCFFSQMIMTNWRYRWREAAPATATAGIRYSGYGHVFRDSYIQGFVHHIWRDRVGGANILDGLYLESALVPDQAIYAPKRWFGNRDVFANGHGDGFLLENAVYDPERVFIFQTSAKVRNSQVVAAGGFEPGEEAIINGAFEKDASDWQVANGVANAIPSGRVGNCLQVMQTGDATAYAYQVIRTIARKRYRLSFDHKNGSYTGRLLVGTGVTGTEYAYVPILDDADWRTHIVYFTPITDTTHIVLACPGASQDTLFDNISVVEVAISADGDVGVNGDVEAAGVYKVRNQQVVGARGAPVADATDLPSLIAQFNILLERLREHGLIAR